MTELMTDQVTNFKLLFQHFQHSAGPWPISNYNLHILAARETTVVSTDVESTHLHIYLSHVLFLTTISLETFGISGHRSEISNPEYLGHKANFLTIKP
jgi:hypothetical protein